MHRIRQIFLLLAIVAPIHVTEELLFGADDVRSIKRLLDGYYRWFGNPDQDTAIVLTLAVASVLLIAYGLVAGGTPRLAAISFFGLVGLVELHHVFKTLVFGIYTPGVVTAVPSVVLGLTLLRAVADEYRRSRIRWADVEPAYQTW